jgi:transposase-like protein
MNKLSTKQRAQILSVLCEGMGINAATRITGVSKNTVLKLLEDAGQACAGTYNLKFRSSISPM